MIEQAFAGGPDVTHASWPFRDLDSTPARLTRRYAGAEYHLGLAQAMNVGLSNYITTRIAVNLFHILPQAEQTGLGTKLLTDAVRINPFNPQPRGWWASLSGRASSALFTVTDAGGQVRFSMDSLDGAVSVRVVGQEADSLPTSSCFGSLAEASAFFEGGSLGYSVTRGGQRLDGLLLRTMDWRIRALAVSEVYSSFFADRQRFPDGSVEFDHALIMRDVLHEWHKAEDLYVLSKAA